MGLGLTRLQGRDGAPDDNRLQLTWALPLGTAGTGARHDGAGSGTVFTDSNLLDAVALRPGWLPTQVVAKRDTSAAPTRLIAVDKTALPAGATVDTATGSITVPLGVAVTGIAGTTRNGGAFANAGQFALS
ncbi:MAG: hypothetical protein Q8Q28_18345 [Pseudomonadota bacterium]|nr:hypothetical protein [Pseudomonadota bacterium]